MISPTFLAIHRLANTKGFILLDMLSREIGRKRFAAILRQFIRGKNNQLTSWKEFQQAVEAGAGKDVHWFFGQWLERKGAPDYQITWRQAGKNLKELSLSHRPSTGVLWKSN